MEKKAEMAARLARNSPAIGAKKAPKLYMVPKTTKPTVKATSTMTQARRESGRLASDGGWGADTFTTFLTGGRKGPSEAVRIRNNRTDDTPVLAAAQVVTATAGRLRRDDGAPFASWPARLHRR